MNENDFSGIKQLRRTRDGRVIAGVAAGLGRYVGVDPNVIRAVLAIATFFGGLGVAIYAIGWLVLPEEDKNRSLLQDLIDKNKDNPVWLDAKAKAEQGWAKATSQYRASHPQAPNHPANQAPNYPTHQEPFPQNPATGSYYSAPGSQHPAPAAPYDTAVGDDDHRSRA
ncbi:phage shock protein PspC (stress-responsive transcriptional regulator) [Streptosporangium becharense]|uniref:Phage shock protein PspC (Stress-responsive transcriptional regulator) n=1 Tax=Streptosporangium becharense TaxID=1816182 RepID=A0A7W9MHM1_9ACTN|nr:PspC domain-containing protein [Streptosporangium becharense]MBB2912450.1 phage shock protein PspC (stress-responsive transcriptional regulator) [Streptosporangium becharense]MBB5820721.1 phage shock protein PspC (stress-responsive transcriptional regulator) [Streptosporangium becharense]